ncbi:MAG: sensor domain-containing diguanylate cyclase [Deltaproteobacteria bacterium]|nr:sensor domain-containing diguanylate cyclase [Deltaproteobacteria bacterium]
MLNPPVFDLQQLAPLLIEHAPDAIVVVDSEGTIVVVNQQTEALFAYAREELLGKSVELLVPEGQRDHHRGRRREAVMQGPPRMPTRAVQARRRDGTVFSAEISLGSCELDQQRLTLAVIRDVGHRDAYEAALKHASWHDNLTGLHNRNYFETERSSLEERSVAVGIAIVDVDGLKVVNDREGHHAGDRLIVRVASALRRASPPEGMLVRLGGDEFLMLIVGASMADMLSRREALTQAVNEENSLRNPGDPELSISIGVAVSEPGRGSISTALEQADKRMYEDKRARRLGRA